MPIQTQWFKDRLAERRMSQRDLARHMGLDSAAISLMLRGKRNMKISEAAEIAQLLGRPAAEIMEAAGVQTGGTEVGVTSFVDGLAEVHACDDEPMMRVQHPGGDLPADVMVTQCRTAGSALDYMDGWLLFSSMAPERGVSIDAVGRLSVCRLTNGVKYLAKPSRGYQKGRWNLSGPAADMNSVAVEWAVPVLTIIT